MANTRSSIMYSLGVDFLSVLVNPKKKTSAAVDILRQIQKEPNLTSEEKCQILAHAYQLSEHTDNNHSTKKLSATEFVIPYLIFLETLLYSADDHKDKIVSVSRAVLRVLEQRNKQGETFMDTFNSTYRTTYKQNLKDCFAEINKKYLSLLTSLLQKKIPTKDICDLLKAEKTYYHRAEITYIQILITLLGATGKSLDFITLLTKGKGTFYQHVAEFCPPATIQQALEFAITIEMTHEDCQRFLKSNDKKNSFWDLVNKRVEINEIYANARMIRNQYPFISKKPEPIASITANPHAYFNHTPEIKAENAEPEAHVSTADSIAARPPTPFNTTLEAKTGYTVWTLAPPKKAGHTTRNPGQSKMLVNDNDSEGLRFITNKDL